MPPPQTIRQLTAAPEGGWCWFNDPRAYSHDGVTYWGYITSSGDVTARSTDNVSGVTNPLVGGNRLHTAMEVDDHDNPSVLVRASDHKLLYFYSKHNGPSLYLSISSSAEDISAFAARVDLDGQLGDAAYTYPSPFQLTGESGSPIYLFYRSQVAGISQWHYGKSSDGGATWASAVAVHGLTYSKIAQSGTDRLDFIVSNHPMDAGNHSVYHFYYQGGNVYKTNGTLIGALGAAMLGPADLTLIHDGSSTMGWVWDVALDPATGHPVCTYVTFPGNDGAVHKYNYARWTGSAWETHEIVDGGPFIKTSGAEAFYSGGLVLDHGDPTVVYASIGLGAADRWDVYRYATADGGATWSNTALTSSGKHVRPVPVLGESSPLRALWMSGRYTSYVDYSVGTESLTTQILALGPSSIETWVTTPAGVYIAHLDRSEESPFRAFAVSRMRGADPGTGSLEHHLDNALLAATPTLLADGNLVHMRYRGRTLVWVIEERKAVLDEGEHATDWVRVTGRGVKQLLGDRTVWPTPFSESALDPSIWGQDNQWRRFVNRAAGEMLWDLISESNGRFPAQLTRGAIATTGADGWTQDFRFDNLLDIVKDVSAAYGDIDMNGLAFSYYNAPGIDRSATVIFEEGADVLRVERTTSDRDTVTWAVAEGVGEGVTAKLAVAKDVTATRRREAYIDAKDAGNVPLVQLRADSAIAELKRADSIALEVTEERFATFDDYDLWDTVRVIAPSRGIDESAVIVALYLVEDGERVRVGIDVNTPRQEALLLLAEGNRSTARSVGIRNRMPQGQLVPFSFSGADVFDDTDTMDVFLAVPDRMYVTIEVSARIRFRQFFASAKSAVASGVLTSDSGGGSTSGSGGGSTPTSGASSAASSASGGGSTPTSGASSASSSAGGSHLHLIAPLGENTYGDDPPHSHTIAHTHVVTIGAHDHTIAHTHVVTIGAHDHTTPNHSHTVPTHTHDLVYGVFKETYPASHSVTLKVYELVASTWTLRTTISALTDDFETVDLTQWITGPGDWRLELKSAAAQPNSGRLGCDVFGYALGAIQSA